MSDGWPVNEFVLLVQGFLGQRIVTGLCSVIHGFDDKTICEELSIIECLT